MSLRLHRSDLGVRKRVPESWRTRNGVQGSGRRPEHIPEVCPTCSGKGYVYDVANNGDVPVVCTTCDGEGEL